MPENPRSGAEDVTLREYMEAQLNGIHREMDALTGTWELKFENTRREMELRDKAWTDAHTASQRAIDKAETDMREKLATMNGIRGVLTDQATQFIGREVFEDLRTRVEGMATRVELEATLRTRETRFGAAETRLATIERTISNYSEERMNMLESWKSNMQGRMWSIPILVGVVVFVITQLMRVLFPAPT